MAPAADRASCPDERRTLDARGRMRSRRPPRPTRPAAARSRARRRAPPREHVAVGLQVRIGVADVGPVRVGDVAEDRKPLVEHQREQLGREVVRLVRRDQVEDLGLEHVDAGVDRVARTPVPRWASRGTVRSARPRPSSRSRTRAGPACASAPGSPPRRSLRWNSTTSSRSMSVSASPEMTRNVP